VIVPTNTEERTDRPDILTAARRDLARRQLRAMLLFFTAAVMVLLLTSLLLGDTEAIVITISNLAVLLVIGWLRHRDRLSSAVTLASLSMLASAAWGTWTTSWGLLDSTLLIFATTVVFGALVLRPRLFYALMVLTFTTVLVIGFRARLGLATGLDDGHTRLIDVVVVVTALAMLAFISRRQSEMLWHTLERAVTNEQNVREANVALEQQREQLAISERRWRSLVTAAPDWIVQLDPAGRVVYANRDGFFADSPRGHHLDEILAPGDRIQLRGAIASVVAEGTPTTLELSVPQTAGPRHCVFHCGPLRDEDVVEGVIVLVNDATDRWHLQQQLQQTQKLESLGQLAGGIAHDFNNVLTVIGGHVDLARDHVAADHPIQNDLEVIDTAIGQASTLTHQILAFSRQQTLHPRPISLAATVDTMGRMLDRIIGEDTSLSISIETDLPPVMADPGSLEQVIMNLVVNARDAIREHPAPGERKIELAAGSRELTDADAEAHGGLAPGRYVAFSVRDTGPGIPPEIQPRIFDPFFTTKAPGQGTGLGLATVFGIVTQSAGAIELQSEPGAGTCLTILLPTVDATPDVTPEATAPAAPRGDGEHILLVEDDPAVLELARTCLLNQGYRVTEAVDGRQALGAFTAAGDIDLVVTDVVMPELDGYQLQQALPAGTPILFTSGHTNTDRITGRPLPQLHPFLPKPFSPDELFRLVHGILRDGTPGP
jgi:signal transduction histidine kinase